MIKRLCVLAVVFMAALAGAVCADVVIGNEFFYRKAKKKTWGLRRDGFIVNSPNGYVIPQRKPGEAEGDYMVFKNGEALIIDGVYNHKGKYWGLLPEGHGATHRGWVPMDHLLTLYTPTDFEIDNTHKFYKYTDSCYAVWSSEEVVVWEWPGSDREKSIIDGKEFASTYHFNKHKTYRDKEGREWGKVGYWAGSRHYISGWICLSDPQNSDIPAFNPAPEPVKWSPDGLSDNINKDSSPTLIIILVMILAAGTAVLARIFWKSNKTKSGGENDD